MKISIVTPVYNRAKLIVKLYDSLKKQYYFNFEWIVVDDGSNDDIKIEIEKLQKNSQFPILFYSQNNSGKCSALNLGISKSNSDLIFVVDSDDYLCDNALEIINDYWNVLNEKSDYIGIAGYKIFNTGEISGKQFCTKKLSCTLNELNYHYNRHGELSLIYRTSILKTHPFYVFENEKFTSEEILYNDLDLIGELLLVDKALTIMEYQADGLTNNYWRLWKNNPKSTIKLLNSKFNHTIDLRYIDILIKKIKTIIQYNMLLISSKDFTLVNSPSIILSILLYIPSFIYFKISFQK